MLNTHSTFVEQQLRILKMADDETLLSLAKLKKRLVDVVQQMATSGNLLNGIEPRSIFVQQRSTAFNMLNGIFQNSASHDTLFNIC